MNKKTPQQHLQRVYEDRLGEGKEAPRIYHVEEIKAGISRRRFLLGTAISITAVAACSPSGKSNPGSVTNGTDLPKYKQRSLSYSLGSTADLHPMAMPSLSFSPLDGRLLSGAANIQNDEGIITPVNDNLKIWDMPSGKLIDTPVTDPPPSGLNLFHALFFLDDGKILVNYDSGTLVFRNYPGLDIIRSVPVSYTATGLQTGFDLSNDGTKFAICTTDVAIVFDVTGETAVETNRFAAQDKEFYLSVKFSPDGTLLAVGTGNAGFKVVRRWRLSDDTPLTDLEPPEIRAFLKVAFSPDGRYIIGLSKQGVYIWNTENDQLVKSLDDQFPYFGVIQMTPDGQAFSFAYANGDTRTLEIRNFSDFSIRKSIDLTVPDSEIFGNDFHSPMVHAYSADGKLIALGFSGGGSAVWELPQGDYLTTLFDAKAFREGFSAKYFSLIDEQSRNIFYVNSCSDAIPNDAVCTCDCVPGEFVPPPLDFRAGRQCGFVCSCNLVCSCNFI